MFEDNPMTRSHKVVQVDSAPVPVATARVLVRDLESDTTRLQFAYFSIETIGTVRDLDAARRFFPEAMRDEWLLIRDYDAIPQRPKPGAASARFQTTLRICSCYCGSTGQATWPLSDFMSPH